MSSVEDGAEMDEKMCDDYWWDCNVALWNRRRRSMMITELGRQMMVMMEQWSVVVVDR
jgi:hypothetical protein